MKHALVVALVFACASCQRSAPPESQSAIPPVIQTAGGQSMVLIPAGEFVMGSDRGEPEQAPAHKVHVNSFLMDRTEVTQAMYDQLHLVDPSKVKGPNLPVHMMSWVLAARYCNARSKAEGLEPCYNEDNASCDFTRNGYRLPTEAEWEYACRAGQNGDSTFTSHPGQLRASAWLAENSGGKPHPVAEKQPNPWGLSDMLGNVAEWCNDMYDKQYYRKSPPSDPRGPDQGDQYVVRGGSYHSNPEAVGWSVRSGDNPGFSDACLAPETLGFRCVRRPPPGR